MRMRIRAFALALVLACLSAFPAWAASGGGTGPQRDGQTDVFAGVAVDYMGKLRFEIKDRNGGAAIPGASVELWIPGLNGGEGAYVLFGVTDEEGALELDVAYNRGGQSNQFETTDGKLTFKGSLLYLSGNKLDYQVYKADWLPYPSRGTVTLELKEIPQVVVVYLHKKGGGGGSGDDGGGGKDTGNRGTPEEGYVIVDSEVPLASIDGPEVPLAPIPKTGVENYALFWGIGGALLLLAAAVVYWLLYREGKNGKTKE